MATTKSFSEPSYAVHRSSDTAGPSNSNTAHFNSEQEQQQEDEDHRSSTPPPYSGPTTPFPQAAAQTTSSQITRYPGLPYLDYRLYSPPHFTLSSDHSTLKSSHPSYSSNPQDLVRVIKSLATVPPKPQIRIVGQQDGDVHFDLRINMMGFIVPDSAKSRLNYVRVIGDGEMAWRGEIKETLSPSAKSLEEWAESFCREGAAVKQFSLERCVTNWDTSYIEGRILSLVSSTSYKGRTTVTFPTTHSTITVRSPDKVNRFFSNVTSLFTGIKKYGVVKSVWPYADVERGEIGRRCAVQSEDVWFSEWRDAIRHAVLSKRKGWVTTEDRLEFLMEPHKEDIKKPEAWGAY